MAGTPAPLYLQVKNYVTAKIGNGEWPVHQRIPSEHQLVEELGVSRMTVHRAFKELTEGHVLHRVPGVGTFVAPGRGHESLIDSVDSVDIGDQILGRGNAHLRQIVLLRKERAKSHLAELFAVPARSTLFHSQIVHFENDFRVMVEDKYVNPACVPGFLEQDFTRTSTTRYLRSAVVATKAEECIEAINPSRSVRTLLTLKSGPCLLLSRRIWMRDVVAIVSQRVYPGAPFQLGSPFKKRAGALNGVR